MKTIKLPEKRISIVFESNKIKYEKLIKQDISNCDGFCYYNSINKIYVGVFNKKKSVLCHELFHCIDFLNQHLSEFDDSKFSESNAYLIGYLFQEFERKL